jgi:hypothetical protein
MQFLDCGKSNTIPPTYFGGNFMRKCTQKNLNIYIYIYIYIFVAWEWIVYLKLRGPSLEKV